MKKTFKHLRAVYPDKDMPINGTGLQGMIGISYKKLVKIFGKPRRSEDCDKIDVLWILFTPAGSATIYNYKDGKNYLGAKGKNVENIKEWHVGGKCEAVYDWVCKELFYQ
jgi:hypothetical protein